MTHTDDRRGLADPSPRRSSRLHRQQRAGTTHAPRGRTVSVGTLAIFLGPFVLLFAFMFVMPIGYAIYQSFLGLQRASAYAAPTTTFVGLSNYIEVLGDPAFHESMRNIIAFGLGPSVLVVLTGLTVALLVDARRPGPAALTMRLASFAPFAVPAVIGSLMWGFLYAPTTSPILQGFSAIGLDFDPRNAPLWAIGNVAIWTYAGFNALIFLAALSAISPSLIEAARVDGAGAWRIAWSIKLPLLRPSLILSAVFNLIGTLQLFTEPTVLRAISNAIPSNWTPNMLAYAEAAANRYSYSATVSAILAIITALFSFGLLRASMSREPS